MQCKSGHRKSFTGTVELFAVVPWLGGERLWGLMQPARGGGRRRRAGVQRASLQLVSILASALLRRLRTQAVMSLFWLLFTTVVAVVRGHKHGCQAGERADAEAAVLQRHGRLDAPWGAHVGHLPDGRG